MNLGFSGQKVLITGSSRGIGRGIAEEFLREEAGVIITGRNENDLENTYRDLLSIYSKRNVSRFSGDLSSDDILDNMFQFFEKSSGSLNHIVCNVGSGKSVQPLDEDVNEFKRMLEINLLNAVGVVNKLTPILKKNVSKTNSFPSITFIGSICGLETLGCPVAYASAKSALVSYAKNISFPLGREGIRVNVVTPGNIMFPSSTWQNKKLSNPKKVEKMLKTKVPLQRFGEIDDIASIVVFLASQRAKFVNGANWVVDGGQTQS